MKTYLIDDETGNYLESSKGDVFVRDVDFLLPIGSEVVLRGRTYKVLKHRFRFLPGISDTVDVFVKKL